MRSLLIAICATALAGCYSKTQLLKERETGYATARAECVSDSTETIEYVNALLRELRAKNERLKVLNQLNADGSLRGKSHAE